MERLPLGALTRIASFVVCIRLELGVTDRITAPDPLRQLRRLGPQLNENRVRHWAQQMGFPFGPFAIRTLESHYTWTSILHCVHVDLPSVVHYANISRMWVKPTAQACTKLSVNTNMAPSFSHKRCCSFSWQKTSGMQRPTVVAAVLPMMQGRRVTEPQHACSWF